MRALGRRPHVLRLNKILLLADAIQNVMPFVALHKSWNNHADHGSAGRDPPPKSRKRRRAMRPSRPPAEHRGFDQLISAGKYQPFPEHNSRRPLKLQLVPAFTPEKTGQQPRRRNPPARRRIKRHASIHNRQRNQSERSSDRRRHTGYIQRREQTPTGSFPDRKSPAQQVRAQSDTRSDQEKHGNENCHPETLREAQSSKRTFAPIQKRTSALIKAIQSGVCDSEFTAGV